MLLVVVPCGSNKVWKNNPGAGPTKAENTYTGPLFKVNKEFAKYCGDQWVILSAKYGFINPDFVIPEDYNVTFKDPLSGPISVKELQEQVREKGLYRYDRVIALGGRDYTSKVRTAFTGTTVKVESPVVGLPIGKMLQRVKELTRAGGQEGEKTVSMPAGADSAKTRETEDKKVLPHLLKLKSNVVPTAQDFQRELGTILAQTQGTFVEVKAGELHRIVGGYPGIKHRMVTCCQVMRGAMRPGDETVAEPPKRNGASLTIRYRLPR